MLEDNCYNPAKTRGVPDQMPLTHSQDSLAQRHLRRRTVKYNRNGHSSRNYANMVVAVVRTCLPHALHHKNSPQTDTSGQEKEGTAKRVMAVHRGERPEYQETESRHGTESSSRPSQMENHCCRLSCQTAQGR